MLPKEKTEKPKKGNVPLCWEKCFKKALESLFFA